MACEITGTAEVGHDAEGGLVWHRADPAIHVAAELLDDQASLRVVEQRYEVGEWCPYHAGSVRHARRRRSS